MRAGTYIVHGKLTDGKTASYWVRVGKPVPRAVIEDSAKGKARELDGQELTVECVQYEWE